MRNPPMLLFYKYGAPTGFHGSNTKAAIPKKMSVRTCDRTCRPRSGKQKFSPRDAARTRSRGRRRYTVHRLALPKAQIIETGTPERKPSTKEAHSEPVARSKSEAGPLMERPS